MLGELYHHQLLNKNVVWWFSYVPSIPAGFNWAQSELHCTLMSLWGKIWQLLKVCLLSKITILLDEILELHFQQRRSDSGIFMMEVDILSSSFSLVASLLKYMYKKRWNTILVFIYNGYFIKNDNSLENKNKQCRILSWKKSPMLI